MKNGPDANWLWRPVMQATNAVFQSTRLYGFRQTDHSEFRMIVNSAFASLLPECIHGAIQLLGTTFTPTARLQLT